jgi:uncharacterized repeat protein (TIGR01451 family)
VRQYLSRMTALAVFLFILPLAIACAGENTWTVSGPPGGVFRDLEASPTDPNVFYAAYGRTFFRSADGTATWNAREFVHEVVDIAVDPTDGTRLYVAALDDGLYRSEDGGLTFTQIAPGNTQVWSVGVGGADGKTVYYATGNGSFFQSTDRGQTFLARPLTALTISQIRVEGANGLSILAVRGNVLAQSPDGGLTWSEAPVDGMNFIQSITRLGSGTLVATTNGGVFTSPDGVTWTQVLTGTFFAASADPANPTAFIAANYGGGQLYRNTNNGNPANWTTFGAPPPLGTPLREIVTSGSPARLILANGQGVQVSLDGGTTWKDASSGLNASAPTRMASTVATNAPVYAYTSADTSGLFSTVTDNGWLRLNLSRAQSLIPSKPLGQATLAVKPGAPLTVYVGAYDAGMFRSDDGGTTWSGPGTGLSGLSPNAIAFDPVDPNVMYASVSQASQTPTAALYSSSDGGATWSPRSADLPDSYGLRLAVQPADGNRMFLAATSGLSGKAGLYGSIDAGVHWTLLAFANAVVHDVALDPSDANRIYVAADGSGLNTSSDGGASFTPNAGLAAITQNQTVVAVALDPAVPTTIYVATTDSSGGLEAAPQSSYILRSVDRGQTWETLRSATDQPAWFVNDLMLDPNVPSLLYAATGGHGVGAFEIVNDLAVSISGHSGTKPKGLPSTFAVNVQNNGVLSATRVHLTVQLPTGLTNVSATVPMGTCTVGPNTVQCDIQVLRPAQSCAVVVTYTPPGEMALPISATVSAHEKDNASANNSAQATATSGEVVDLRVTVSPSASSPTVGGTITYAVQVSNAGPLASSSATLTFALGSGVSFAGTAPAGCSVSNGTATCTLATLIVGASQSFAFSATANTAGNSVATATIAPAPNATDADQSNNTGQATVNIGNAPPPNSGYGGGGGGGSLDYLILLALSLVIAFRCCRMQSLSHPRVAYRSMRPGSGDRESVGG